MDVQKTSAEPMASGSVGYFVAALGVMVAMTSAYAHEPPNQPSRSSPFFTSVISNPTGPP